MSEKGGRPTEYKEEYCDEVDVYLKENKDEYEMIDDYKEDEKPVANDTELKILKRKERRKGIIKVNLPTIEGFALRLNVSEKTLYNWRDKHPKFLQSLGKINREQKKRLLNMGLSGEYNSTIAKLILSSNHGMVERSDITTKDKELPKSIINLKDYVQGNNGNEEDSETKEKD